MCFKFSEYVVYITPQKYHDLHSHHIHIYTSHHTYTYQNDEILECMSYNWPSLRFCTFELFISHYIVIQTTQTGLSNQFIYDAKWSFRKRTDARNLDWNTYTWNTEAGLEHLHLEHLNNFREPTRLTPDVWDPSKLFVVCYVVYQFEIVWDDFIKSSNFHF